MRESFIDDAAVGQYIQRRKVDCESCANAIDSEDFETLCFIGHKIKGNGASFGFPELTDMGDRMEVAGREKNLSAVKEEVQFFFKWIESHQDLIIED